MENQLPNLILLKIFDYLEYNDLLIIVRVNEEWKDLVMSIIKSKVVVVNENKEDYESSYFSKKYIIAKSQIVFKQNTDLHMNITNLVLFYPSTLFNLKNFDNLIELVIRLNSNLKISNQKFFLKLKNLEQLSVFFDPTNNLRSAYPAINFILELPKLSYFTTNVELNYFQILYANSVKYFSCSKTTSLIKQFKCLEKLSAMVFLRIDDLFEDLISLKSFIFYRSNEDLNAIIHYLQSKQAINKNLTIYYKQIDHLSNPHQQNEIVNSDSSFLTDQEMQVYFTFIDFIKDDHLNQKEIRISNLDNLPVEVLKLMIFFRKLKFSSKTIDEEKWIKLLAAPKLVEINLTSIIAQNHLDLIPVHCKQLRCLEINDFENGQFILALKFLKQLKTKQLIDIQLFKNIIMTLYYLNTIEMSDFYKIEIDKNVVRCFLNDKIVLKKSKSDFIQIICLSDYWSDIFLIDQ